MRKILFATKNPKWDYFWSHCFVATFSYSKNEKSPIIDPIHIDAISKVTGSSPAMRVSDIIPRNEVIVDHANKITSEMIEIQPNRFFVTSIVDCSLNIAAIFDCKIPPQNAIMSKKSTQKSPFSIMVDEPIHSIKIGQNIHNRLAPKPYPRYIFCSG